MIHLSDKQKKTNSDEGQVTSNYVQSPSNDEARTVPTLQNKYTQILRNHWRRILLILVVFLGGMAVFYFQSSKQTDNKAATTPSTTEESDLLSGQTFDCEPIGNDQYFRTDRTFAIDPKDPHTMYINVEHKGFFKSIDGGRTWTLKTKGIKAYGRKDDPAKPCYAEYPVLVIDPKNSQHLILALSGTPTTFDTGYTKAGGLVESWNGGDSWKQMLQGWMNIYVNDIAIDPNDSKIIYYSTTAEPASYIEADPNKAYVTKGLIYKTTDGGKTWEELPTGFLKNSSVISLFINPNNPQEIFATTFTAAPHAFDEGRKTDNVEQMGNLRSLDGGKTWKQEKTLPEDYRAIMNMGGSTVSPNNYQNIFVIPASLSTQPPKTFYSMDGGNIFNTASTYLDSAKFDPHDLSGNHLLGYYRPYTPGEKPGIWESINAGKTWQRLTDAPKEILADLDHLQHISNIVWDPQVKTTVYITGAGGYIWKSIDSGKNWLVVLSFDKLP